MSKFDEFESDELNLIKCIFNQLNYLQLDVNLAYIVESYIYVFVKEYYTLENNDHYKNQKRKLKEVDRRVVQAKLGEIANVVPYLKCEYLTRFGEKNGLYKEYYLCGSKWVECFYSKDKLNGEHRTWWKNGNKSEECFYSEDKLVGEYRSWWKNGNKFEECFYSDGKLVGEYKSWESTVENLTKHCFYSKSGRKDGTYKTWWSNGQKHIECFYTDGVLNGEYKRWDEYGVLVSNLLN
jgi:antitoxin component YwqK of YwqJK toxin-antitoxin module